MSFWRFGRGAVLNVTRVDTNGHEWTRVDIFLGRKGLTDFRAVSSSRFALKFEGEALKVRLEINPWIHEILQRRHSLPRFHFVAIGF